MSVVKGSVDLLKRQLRTNDNFLNEFKFFNQDFKISTQHQLLRNHFKNTNPSLGSSGINAEIDQLNKDLILPYFVIFQGRNNKDYVGDDDILEILTDKKISRSVDKSLELMSCKNRGYVERLEQSISNVHKIRKTSNEDNNANIINNKKM